MPELTEHAVIDAICASPDSRVLVVGVRAQLAADRIMQSLDHRLRVVVDPDMGWDEWVVGSDA